MKKLFLIVPLILAMCLPVMAANFDLVLQWDSNTEPDLATGDNPRYKIYYKTDASGAGQKSNYIGLPNSEPDVSDEGPTTVNVTVAMDENPDPAIVQFTLHNLEDSKNYYIAVTALDESGNESDLSNEVSYAGIFRQAPVIDVFAKTSQTGRTVSLSLGAHDDIAVNGYALQVNDPVFKPENIVQIDRTATANLNFDYVFQADGDFTLYAWAIDNYEDVSDVASIDVMVDTAPPAAPHITWWEAVLKWLKGWFK